MEDDKASNNLWILKLWPIAGAVLFIVFAAKGHAIAAILVGASALLAFQPLRGTLERFGLRGSLRSNLCLGAALLSFAIHLFSGGEPAYEQLQEVPEEAIETEASQNESEEVTSNYLADATGADDSVSALTGSLTGGDYIHGCSAVDGDTLNCAGERIRLLGIDAPELPGHCALGRVCAPGDPYASTQSLRSKSMGQLTIERIGTDHYGRTIAMVYANGLSLSCQQLEAGQAVYVANWDDGGRVQNECGAY